VSEPRPWREAWQNALYGPRGFYRQAQGPAGHFTTATQAGSGQALAQTLWAWADRYGLDGIVDVGAGRGELLRHLYACWPGRPLTGLDVVDRPADLPEPVAWVESPGGVDLPAAWRPDRALVVAHEWLDVVPCTVAEVAPDGLLREVFVDPATGTESLGPELAGSDLEWCQRFWPAEPTAAAAGRRGPDDAAGPPDGGRRSGVLPGGPGRSQRGGGAAAAGRLRRLLVGRHAGLTSSRS